MSELKLMQEYNEKLWSFVRASLGSRCGGSLKERVPQALAKIKQWRIDEMREEIEYQDPGS